MTKKSEFLLLSENSHAWLSQKANTFQRDDLLKLSCPALKVSAPSNKKDRNSYICWCTAKNIVTKIRHNMSNLLMKLFTTFKSAIETSKSRNWHRSLNTGHKRIDMEHSGFDIRHTSLDTGHTSLDYFLKNLDIT